MKTVPILLACALAASWAAAQSKSPPEVRVSGRAYILPPPLIKAQTDLVTLDVVVRNPDGSLIAGLTRDSFRLLDDGQPRSLSAFSVESGPAPALRNGEGRSMAGPEAGPPLREAHSRSVALYFDDVNTDKADLGGARNAAERFVREALDPGDRVAVFTASSEQSLDFTSDAGKLEAAIAQIRPHPRTSSNGLGDCPRISPYEAYLIANRLDPSALDAAMAEKKACDKQIGIVIDDGTQDYTKAIPGNTNDSEQVLTQSEATWELTRAASYDTLAAEKGVVEFLAKQPGSRMLLMASGGFLSGTMGQQQDDIVQAALRAGVVINALDAKGLYTDGPGRPIDELPDLPELPLPTYFFEETSKLSQRQSEDAAMANLAESTGGLLFHDNNDLTLGFERLGMMPEITYQLAFAPGDIPHDGKYHKLKLELTPTRRGAIVQARPGYFAPSPAAGAASAQEQIDAAMRGSDALADVPASAIALPGLGQEIVDVRLDINHLAFQNQKGRRRQDLRFVAGLFDSNGKFIVGKQGEMDLALTPETWKRLATQGLSAKLSLPAPAGTYRLRVVVEQIGDGKLFAFTQQVQIP